jgi:hypothetical protein
MPDKFIQSGEMELQQQLLDYILRPFSVSQQLGGVYMEARVRRASLVPI